MLTVWWLSSFILISTLNGYFDNQDRDFLTGKLQLTEEFLKTETFRNKTDIKSLSEKINDAMVGHNGLFISIKNMENEKIVELYAKNSVVPAVLLNKSGDILDYMIQTEENNTVYRSISRRVAVTPEQGKSKHVHHYGCHGYWVSHPVYGQTQYLAVLVQYRSGLYFCFSGLADHTYWSETVTGNDQSGFLHDRTQPGSAS
jgi:hypothetical protein